MRKDIFLAIFSALLGVILGHTARGFNASSIASWAILGFLFVAMLLSLALIGPVPWLLQSSKGVRLSGTWTGTWTYQKGGKAVKVVEEIELRQIGQLVWGDASSRRITGPHPTSSLKYSLLGRVLPNGVFEGTWKNTELGKRYHGTFLARVHNGGRGASGVWGGIGEAEVNNGRWDLSRG